MFPRAMNNIEKAGLKIVKESGKSYEVKYNNSKYSGGFMVSVPCLMSTYSLSQISLFEKDLKRFEEKLPPYHISY